MGEPQKFIGTVAAATTVGKLVSNVSWKDVISRILLILAVVLVIIASVFIRTKLEDAEQRVVAAEKKLSEAQLSAAQAQADASAWKQASIAQSAKFEKMNMTFETMTKRMEIRDQLSEQRWATTEKAITGIQNRAEDIINAPAAAPEYEIPVARAKLKDTKGYRLDK